MNGINGWAQTLLGILVSVFISVGTMLYSFGRLSATTDFLSNQVASMEPLVTQMATNTTKLDELYKKVDEFIQEFKKNYRP